MALRLLRFVKLTEKNNKWRNLHTTRMLPSFYEMDRKGGSPRISDYKEEEKGPLQRIREGYGQFWHEMRLLKEQLKEYFRMDPEVVIPPGEVDVFWKFDGDPKKLEKWVVTSDSDLGYGNSTASLELSPHGVGVFSGILDTRPIQDGKIKATGFCNVKTVRPRKAFYIETEYDWGVYTHLIMRVRGDGRNYMLNLYVKNDYDIMWNDLHNFILYTRGGPYWQYVKIPFSKFFLSSKGRIQDLQGPVRLHSITALSITASDGIPGPFKLEIDFIGCERDLSLEEEFAYELYKPPQPFYS